MKFSRRCICQKSEIFQSSEYKYKSTNNNLVSLDYIETEDIHIDDEGEVGPQEVNNSEENYIHNEEDNYSEVDHEYCAI